jgi:hypothetical protein
MSRRILLSALALLGFVAAAVPSHAARPVVGPQVCKYYAVIQYDYDCDGIFEVGVSDPYSTPTDCRYGVIELVQNAQHFGFCWWTPGVNCQPGPTGCYESLPADEYPPPRE